VKTAQHPSLSMVRQGGTFFFSDRALYTIIIPSGDLRKHNDLQL
jgi:hypothetical protein